MNTQDLILFVITYPILIGITGALLISIGTIKLINPNAGIYRMRVKWVHKTCETERLDFEENIYVLVIAGNVRNVAINSAEFRHFWHKGEFDCMTAWWNPIDFKQLLPKNLGI